MSVWKLLPGPFPMPRLWEHETDEVRRLWTSEDDGSIRLHALERVGSRPSGPVVYSRWQCLECGTVLEADDVEEHRRSCPNRISPDSGPGTSRKTA